MNTNNKMGASYISEQRSMNGIKFPASVMHNPAFSCHDTHPDCSSTWHEMLPHPLNLNLRSELWDRSPNFSGLRPPQHFYSSGSRASSSPCSSSFQHPYVIAGISLTGHEALQSSKMLGEMQPNHNAMEQMLSNRKLCATNNVLEHSSNPWNRATVTHTSGQTDGVTAHKQRIRWTAELHEQFVEAVNRLGGPKKATPKGILRIMRVAGLTIFHIKSHLQKYRMVKKIPSHIEGKRVKINNYDGMKTPSNPNINGRIQMAEALHFQMEIQKKLNENLELQRYFQKRVEEQEGYPMRVYDEQKKMQDLYQNQYLSNVVVPNTADSVLGGNKKYNGT